MEAPLSNGKHLIMFCQEDKRACRRAGIPSSPLKIPGWGAEFGVGASSPDERPVNRRQIRGDGQ